VTSSCRQRGVSLSVGLVSSVRLLAIAYVLDICDSYTGNLY
jgi:hypothetical protein